MDDPDTGFAPIAGPDARVLLLGSMPSQASLAAGQYYGHPRNAFWWIMGRLFGAGPDLPYPERCSILTDHGLAVWDSLRSCSRPGSLDSAIVRTSEVANDFRGFFSAHPGIERIGFNGRKAEQAFLRHSRGDLSALAESPELVLLPSTSPAMAGMSREQKLGRWREALNPAHFGGPGFPEVLDREGQRTGHGDPVRLEPESRS